MDSKHHGRWWQRLLQKWGWHRKGIPTWGEGEPTILGICLKCGAIVLQGWHQEVPGGLWCRRCAEGKG